MIRRLGRFNFGLSVDELRRLLVIKTIHVLHSASIHLKYTQIDKYLLICCSTQNTINRHSLWSAGVPLGRNRCRWTGRKPDSQHWSCAGLSERNIFHRKRSSNLGQHNQHRDPATTTHRTKLHVLVVYGACTYPSCTFLTPALNQKSSWNSSKLVFVEWHWKC